MELLHYALSQQYHSDNIKLYLLLSQVSTHHHGTPPTALAVLPVKFPSGRLAMNWTTVLCTDAPQRTDLHTAHKTF